VGLQLAFKRQSMLYHPDKNPGVDVESMFMGIKVCWLAVACL
jgi:DnaJ-class molecular chaperone